MIIYLYMEGDEREALALEQLVTSMEDPEASDMYARHPDEPRPPTPNPNPNPNPNWSQFDELVEAISESLSGVQIHNTLLPGPNQDPSHHSSPLTLENKDERIKTPTSVDSIEAFKGEPSRNSPESKALTPAKEAVVVTSVVPPALPPKGVIQKGREKMALRIWKKIFADRQNHLTRNLIITWRIALKIALVNGDRDMAWVGADRMTKRLGELQHRVLQLSYRSFGEV